MTSPNIQKRIDTLRIISLMITVIRNIINENYERR